MRQIDRSIIKARCLRFAVQNEMEIKTLDNETFQAESQYEIINIPISFIYDSVQNGWEVEEVLQNEACHNE